MSKREIKILLDDIIESINNIESYITKLNKTQFFSNKMAVDAVVRNLEIIGEATKNIPDDYKMQHSNVDWRGMAGLRDVIIHGYFNVDLEIIWEIIQQDMPQLKKNILPLLD